MAKILFVHGTGTREVEYAAALRKLRFHLAEHEMLPCLWGGSAGARMQLEGAAVPEYEDSKPAAGGFGPRSGERAVVDVVSGSAV